MAQDLAVAVRSSLVSASHAASRSVTSYRAVQITSSSPSVVWRVGVLLAGAKKAAIVSGPAPERSRPRSRGRSHRGMPSGSFQSRRRPSP